MMHMLFKIIFCLSLLFYMTGCYPNTEVKMYTAANSLVFERTANPERWIKIVLTDSSSVILQEGFSIKNDTLAGRGCKYAAGETVPDILQKIKIELNCNAGVFSIPVGDIATFEQDEPKRNIASTSMYKSQSKLEDIISVPTKVYLKNGSIVLLPDGFIAYQDTIVYKKHLSEQGQIENQSQLIKLDGSIHKISVLKIPFADIAALTTHEPKISAGRGLGSLFLVTTGAVLTPLSIYCLSCPKCCFGSCPTVYTFEDSCWSLETELFSSSIAKQLENDDLDLLNVKVPDNRNIKLRVTNEAMETHYINEFTLLAVSASKDVRIFPGTNNQLVVIRNLQPPLEAINSKGEDILNLIEKRDEHWYRGVNNQDSQFNYTNMDWIDFKLAVPEGAQTVKGVIRYRNTLLSTVLLYDVVLASQGIKALEWNARMDHDSIYANQFRQVYNLFSGIKVYLRDNSNWQYQQTIPDAGPISWKTIAFETSVSNLSELSLRLECFNDNFMIDYVGFDFSSVPNEELLVDVLSPEKMSDYSGKIKTNLLPLIQNDDHEYLITEPGEHYLLSYSIPEYKGYNTTLFIRSKGYYQEWIRGSWLKTNTEMAHFNLFDINQTFSQLEKSWHNNKELIESNFFNSRIQLREE